MHFKNQAISKNILISCLHIELEVVKVHGHKPSGFSDEIGRQFPNQYAINLSEIAFKRIPEGRTMII